MPDIFSEIKGYGVANIASLNGLDVLDGKSFGPCPVCGAKHRHTKRHDPRLACIIVQGGNGWVCLQCEAKGDSVALAARLANGGELPASAPRWREVASKALSALNGGVSDLGAVRPLPHPRTPQDGAARALPTRPPYAETMSLWHRSLGIPPEGSLPWLAEKFPRYTTSQIVEAGTVRFLPKQTDYPWWPWQHRYMAMLAFDHHGLVQSMHARMMKEPDPGMPKSRFPKGFSASGLVLANKTGTGWLRGKMEIENVVIAEGLTSTLATTMALKATNKWNWGVFGYTSGSQDCIKQMPWSKQTVYIITDHDKAGDSYAQKVLGVLPNDIDVRRGTL